jgi:E3 ubiquitin-protein ligase TRIP12
MLFGNTDEDWSVESASFRVGCCMQGAHASSSSSALNEVIKADHGFNVESRAIRDLVEIMSTYDIPTRRAYLQFITGSPKLPIGGKPAGS